MASMELRASSIRIRYGYGFVGTDITIVGSVLICVDVKAKRKEGQRTRDDQNHDIDFGLG